MDCAKSEELNLVQGGCRCASRSPGERYLTSSPAANQQEAAEDELLHVLVTRPEIAGKPRDNILFEGDMDLKTTFETSYEALARMRLECWRRHQEQAAARESCCGSKTCRASVERKAEPEEERLQSRRQLNQSAVEQNRRNDKTSSEQQVVSVAAGAVGEKVAVEAAAAADRDSLLESRKKVVVESSKSGSKLDRRVDAAVQVDLVEPLQPATPSTQQQQQQQQQCRAKPNQIDPDLTPIIVYDANMNRLERVGLRKRSKYRPSTSLRSGSRGLFGDCEEPAVAAAVSNGVALKSTGGGGGHGSKGSSSCQPVAATQSINRARQQQQAASAAGGATCAEDLQTLPNNRQEEMGIQDYNITSRPWDPEPTSKTELALNARNLKDSRQKDYLTYTDINLPIDCKRKLRDNVNMIDHIRDQTEANVAKAMSQSMPINHDEELQDLVYQEEESQQQQQLDLQDDTLDEETEDVAEQRLAKQEEEDAMEELRKITENARSCCDHSININNCASEMSDMNNPRKTRLKRTCQNQNFDIHNQYQEEVAALPEVVGAGSSSRVDERGTRLIVSPQSKMYTNLFRESPDFILTTGKFLDQEVKRGLSGI